MTSPDVADAVAVLRRGGLVAFPTETVYGLGADAGNPAAVERLFAVKGRPRTHPVIIHLAEATAVKGWAAEVPQDAWALADAFWPGPLTLILPAAAHVPRGVTGGAATVGLRVPAQPLALELLAAFGGGIAAPSANRFGRVSPTTAAHVRADLGADVDQILDGGPCAVGVESTIVDLSRGTPRVLRLGGLSVEALSEVLGYAVEVLPLAAVAAGAGGGRAGGPGPAGAGVAHGGPTAVDPDAPPAPGTLASHYAPEARVEVVAVEAVAQRAAALLAEGRRVGLLAPRRVEGLPPGVDALPPAGGSQAYAQCLYQRLREADRRGLDVLLAVPPPETGIGAAVADRLRRAAAAG
ncbi:MAG TPA: L-threonylcarbamoyladenylate synthase [Acidimicrobiia bacterium]|nr:L-threonylcarbamoyladenylate synthase [Acidimicrobiia bacterium]